MIKAKNAINRLTIQLNQHISLRVTSDGPQRRLTYQSETELIETLKRVYYFTKRIAKEVLDARAERKAEATGAQE